ncbi:MAG: ABC transporter ATP-binding protein [Endomicrobium sp.]|jgi:ABC-type lipoprotein export system ATPase subunit|nr:ABC transporter ATP-binding protein [Endomicrobium sp.]
MNIKSENLNKIYVKKGLPDMLILNDINIEIVSGQKVALTGPSGAGKSTLIHILGLMDRPTSGRVYIDGIDCFNNDDMYLCAVRKNNIGFIFQFHYLMLDFSVLENVLLPVWSKRLEKLKYARSILKKLEILDRQNHFPNELSGGEQQRVALARAVINNPHIIFADEPTGNLDRVAGLEIEKLLFEISSELGSTLMLVTHNEELASRADKIIKIVNGKIYTDTDD